MNVEAHDRISSAIPGEGLQPLDHLSIGKHLEGTQKLFERATQVAGEQRCQN